MTTFFEVVPRDGGCVRSRAKPASAENDLGPFDLPATVVLNHLHHNAAVYILRP
jgi:hypothetical protein